MTDKGQEQYDGLLTRSYFDIPRERIGVLAGSQGYVEVALKEQSAAAKLGVKPMDSVRIRIS